MNIIVYKIDSISYEHFKRSKKFYWYTFLIDFKSLKFLVMPLTFKYLTNGLESNIFFTNLNSVGENTRPNIMPLFSGIVVEGIESLKVRPEINPILKLNDEFYDNFPFNWYEYENEGYLTATHEDLPMMGPFNFNKKGFRFRPTSFYGRPMWQNKYNSMTQYPKDCNRGSFVFKKLNDINEDFLRRMKLNSNLPYFLMCSTGQYTHDYLVLPPNYDQEFYKMLKSFELNGYLENTLFILYR